jgi:hypothetical protein
MDEYEQQWADLIRDAVNAWSTTTERAEQDKQFIIGPSAIGYCSERLRRQLDRQEPEDFVDWNKAFIGTWLGEGLEQALKKARPNLLTQSEFWVTLEGDRYTYKIPAHADVIDPDAAAVIDLKAKDGLMYVRRQETADQGYQFQRHLYGLGAWQSGIFGQRPLSDVKVGNAYYDRSGKEPVPHVQIEPYSPEVVRQAIWWLDEVVERFLAGEEAEKEPPRSVCETTCGFFTKCRGYDTDVEGVIRDKKHLEAIDMYLDGGELERKGKKMKNEASIILNGVEGHTPSHTLRWTLVNGGPVSFVRDSYLRMSLTKKKGPRK